MRVLRQIALRLGGRCRAGGLADHLAPELECAVDIAFPVGRVRLPEQALGLLGVSSIGALEVSGLEAGCARGGALRKLRRSLRGRDGS